jgi:hypothetical protein
METRVLGICVDDLGQRRRSQCSSSLYPTHPLISLASSDPKCAQLLLLLGVMPYL